MPCKNGAFAQSGNIGQFVGGDNKGIMVDCQPLDLSVVVPTYRSAEALPELADRVLVTFDALGVAGELVIVNDHSPDDTWEVLTGLAARDDRIRGVDLLSNHGQAQATLCGLSLACGELVATMDDDLQQQPEDLTLLLEALRERPDLDCVVGSWPRDQPRGTKRLGSWVHGRVDHIVHGTPASFRHTSFRLMRRPVVNALVGHETRTPVLGPLVSQTAGNIDNVQVRHFDRARGHSTIGLRESVSRVVTNAVHGTEWPLHAITAIGIGSSFFSFALGMIFFVRWVLGVSTPPGWASVFSATVFFGGLILLAIGTIGRYLAVILQETRGRPKWAVRTTTSAGGGDVLRAVELDEEPDMGEHAEGDLCQPDDGR